MLAALSVGSEGSDSGIDFMVAAKISVPDCRAAILNAVREIKAILWWVSWVSGLQDSSSSQVLDLRWGKQWAWQYFELNVIVFLAQSIAGLCLQS